MVEFDRHNIQHRFSVLVVVVLLLFTFLITGFFRIQVINRAVYVQKSLDNSIRRIQSYPVRGLICDRDADILVDNRPSFSVAVIPKVINRQTLSYLEKAINIPVDVIREKMRKDYGYRPVIITRDIEYKKVIQLEEDRLYIPGVLTLVEPKRHYPEGVQSPHIFGSVGEVTVEEEARSSLYESGDIIGKSGLENIYDLDLRGSKGVRYLRVDASGRELGHYDHNLDVPPVHGSDIFLYLDYDMQQFAESLMVDYRGALVAIDVRNGGILALVSKPDYDPRLLTGKIDPDVWNSLQTDEARPLYSRAVQSRYPPGSTYKIVAAVAALQEDIITPAWKTTCPGYFRLGRKIIHCWNASGHGTLDLYGAIKHSCNVYFYQLGLKIGLEAWTEYSRMFGFGTQTGIDLAQESRGLVPSVEFFNNRYGVNGWTKGNLANLAIGQGELLVTPLQLAQFVMILANKGVYHRPHLVDHMYNYSNGSTVKFPIETRYVTGISDDVYDVIREGMRQVCDGGTGWLGKVPGIEMAGKTGTAQNPHGDTHAWFMAFAPYELPEVAISVIVENAGGGGAIAAPIARKFLEKYFYNRLIPRYVAVKDTVEEEVSDSTSIPFNIESFQPLEILFPRESED